MADNTVHSGGKTLQKSKVLFWLLSVRSHTPINVVSLKVNIHILSMIKETKTNPPNYLVTFSADMLWPLISALPLCLGGVSK